MAEKIFGSLEKPQKRYVNKQIVKAYRERHDCCEKCSSNDFFGTPSGGAHHLLFKSQGGDDLPENLYVLCAKCHGKAHNGTYSREYLLGLKNAK